MAVSDGVKKWTRIVLGTATYLVVCSAVAFADLFEGSPEVSMKAGL